MVSLHRRLGQAKFKREKWSIPFPMATSFMRWWAAVYKPVPAGNCKQPKFEWRGERCGLFCFLKLPHERTVSQQFCHWFVVFLSLPFFHVYALQIPNMWDINFDRSDGLQSGKSKSFPIHWNTGLDLIKTDNIIVQHYGTFSWNSKIIIIAKPDLFYSLNV